MKKQLLIITLLSVASLYSYTPKEAVDVFAQKIASIDVSSIKRAQLVLNEIYDLGTSTGYRESFELPFEVSIEITDMKTVENASTKLNTRQGIRWKEYGHRRPRLVEAIAKDPTLSDCSAPELADASLKALASYISKQDRFSMKFMVMALFFLEEVAKELFKDDEFVEALSYYYEIEPEDPETQEAKGREVGITIIRRYATGEDCVDDLIRPFNIKD